MKNDILAFLWPAIAGLLAAILILDRWVIEDPAVVVAGDAVATYREAVTRATPSVVNIYTAKVVETRQALRLNDPLLRRYLGPRGQRLERSLGSGVIMSADGHIMTNNHVIADADAIQVALNDGRQANATVVGSDPATDLAVLKIDLPDLSPIEAADSDAISVGDVVLAIGNPYGFGHSVSQGIVSGLGRFGLQLSAYEDYIQTDASSHPGNSGGALIDTRGRLVGINTLIYTANGDDGELPSGIGINLATPSNLATFVLDDLVRYGSVIRGWLGVSVELVQGRSADGRLQQFLRVTGVAPQGPAARAGIQVGDVIMALDGEVARDGRIAMHRIARLRPGERLAVQLRRGDETLAVEATVGTREPTQG